MSQREVKLQLTSLRDGLVKAQRARAKAGKGKGKATDGSQVKAPVGVEAAQEAAAEPPSGSIDSFGLVLQPLSFDISVYIAGGEPLSTAVLALEVLELLLRSSTFAVADNSEDESIQELCSATFLSNIASLLYSLWDSGSTTLVHKCRNALDALLALSRSINSDVAPKLLQSYILVDPWLSKRTVAIFDALRDSFTVEETAMFSTAKEVDGVSESVGAGVLRRLLDGMAISDEIATLSGKVAVCWVEKVWEEGKEGGGFWTDPLIDACRGSQRGRSNACLYVLPGLFKARPRAFKELVTAGNFVVDAASSDEASLIAALAVLKVGNSCGLLKIDSDDDEVFPPSKSNSAPKAPVYPPDTTISLPYELLSTCLDFASPSLRTSVLSLLVLSPQPSTPIPISMFPLLQNFYVQSLGDEDGEFRMESQSLSGKLLIRLRDSSWKSVRLHGAGSAYVLRVQAFLQWWSGTLLFNLNPAKPFRIRINALRLLDLLFQANLDPTFDTNPRSSSSDYSSYRRTPPTPIPLFNSQLSPATSDKPKGWPFEVPLVTPSNTFNLLRLLLSTYTVLRGLSISLLERFPSPLPGYSDEGGDERAKRELLLPALKMVRSGREAPASAGAGIIGLVWTKWVLEDKADWDLGHIGGWTPAAHSSAKFGPFSFLNSLMDLADQQLDAHAADLGRAASTTPMHGTLLALRHLFSSIPLLTFNNLETETSRRALFLRALGVVERVWAVTSPVLAATVEQSGGVDTEEARALMVEDDAGEEDGEEDADGTGGPMHKVIMSATWRAMKENGELLETILRIPAEQGLEGFQSIWRLEDVQHIGDLYSTWLARIRHRGAFMAIHPSYSRVSSALLTSKGWSEVQQLPTTWLEDHIEGIVSKKASITRRSAGLPYCILSLMTAVLPIDKGVFNRAFVRLLEIAESKEDGITDESRVHAMNTLRTTFLDAKTASAANQFIERGFVLSISMFWSNNWICRNVAMMLFSALVLRTFGSKRLNLERDYASHLQRLSITDFFGRYPSLHKVLLSELKYSIQEHLDDLPTSNLHSSLFIVLMLLSLVQSPSSGNNSSESSSFQDPFIPLVEICAKSRVWKIRNIAGDALTGLVPSKEGVGVCVRLLSDLTEVGENELHGRLVQVHRLLQTAAPLSVVHREELHEALDHQWAVLVSSVHSFSVRTVVLQIVLAAGLTSSVRLGKLLDFARKELKSSQAWPTPSRRLPSAENYVTAALSIALAGGSTSVSLLEDGLMSSFIEVQRKTLDYLDSLSSPNGMMPAEVLALRTPLLDLAISDTEACECRVAAINLLETLDWSVGETKTLDRLLALHSSTTTLPVREALLPLIAKMVSSESQTEGFQASVEKESLIEKSVESRLSAALALGNLPTSSAQAAPWVKSIALRLLQDDDPDVREIMTRVVAKNWTSGKVLAERRICESVMDIETDSDWDESDLDRDLEHLSNPSSLLFAVENPNLYKDVLLATELSAGRQQTISDDRRVHALARLEAILANDCHSGPLGKVGDEIVCKWAFRLAGDVPGEFANWLRTSFVEKP